MMTPWCQKRSRKGAIFHINWSSGPRYCSRSVGTTFGRCCEGSIFKNTSEKLFQFLGKIERCFRCSPKSGQFMLKLESLNFRSITFGAGLFHVPCSIHSIVLYTDSIDVLCVSGWCFDGDHQQTKWTSIKQVDSRFLRRRCGWHFLTARCTLLETNTSHEKTGVGRWVSFWKGLLPCAILIIYISFSEVGSIYRFSGLTSMIASQSVWIAQRICKFWRIEAILEMNTKL